MVMFITAIIINIGTCKIIPTIVKNNNNNNVTLYVSLHNIIAVITPIIITITVTT